MSYREHCAKTDASLLREAAIDPDAFRLFYDRYCTLVHAFFERRTGNVEVALDLTAETFAQAWRSKTRFRDRAAGSAAPWLFTIARRVLIRSVQRRRLDDAALERLHVDRGGWSHGAAAPNEWWLEGMDAEIDEALKRLPGEQRRAIELRFFRDLPYVRIAAELACTPTAARIRVSRGLATLRARLEGGSR